MAHQKAIFKTGGIVRVWAWLSVAMVFLTPSKCLMAESAALRQVMSLDGAWQIEEGGMEAMPKEYKHTVVVPGLVDMATPPFVEVAPPVADRQCRAQKDPRRDAFWYRRTFKIDGPIPSVAVLKVSKAMFGTHVFLNGKDLGEHLPCFTPGLFPAHDALKQGENELVIRIGADRDAVTGKAQSGFDSERVRYVPGIFDSVELILSGSPHIERVQAAPDIEKKSVSVHTWLSFTGDPKPSKLHLTVREAKSGKIVGEGECETPKVAVGEEAHAQTEIALHDCQLWSPENPFLYELEVRGEADALKTRFGMRSFRFDPETGRAVLNGRPYFMRGTSVTLYRLFEDDEHGDKPWREDWVRLLYQRFRDMNWNSVRNCICFPPERWYDIADEEGILLQDEFPIWFCMAKPEDIDGDELAVEYREWMQERWNHASVVIWDGCNETYSPETGKAIRKVRSLDYSNRPWDNGWGEPVEPGDSDEVHPYHFIFGPIKEFRLKDLAAERGDKAGLLISQPFADQKLLRKNCLIINEYGGLWLNRDGSPTTLTVDIYKYLLGPNSTAAERRRIYARYMAAITEFFRSHRQAAGVLYYGAIDYSRPDGQTSDNWQDVATLTWDPDFYQYVRDAFAPVGILLDFWAEEVAPGTREFPVAVINDTYEAWNGTIRLRLTCEGQAVAEKSQPAEVAPLGRETKAISLDVPSKSGLYEIEASLVVPNAQPVRSVREFRVP